MFRGWWGKILLVILFGVFSIAMIASWKGTYLPPLMKSGHHKHIRSGSKHYFYGGTSGRRGATRGGGMRAGK